MEVIIGLIVLVVGVVGLLVPLIALGSIVNGYVLKILWGLFIVPVFHLPTLTIAQAIGISIVVGMFTRRSSSSKKDGSNENDKKKILTAFAEVFLMPFLALGIGWIVHQFV